MSKQRLTAYCLLLVTAAIWGVASPVIKFTVAYLPPFTFLFYRFFIASLFFLPSLLYLIKQGKETIKSALTIAPIGFLGIPLCLGFLFLGLEKTTSLDAVVISSLSPIFICLAGVLFLKEKMSRLEIVGSSLAVGGSIVMIAQPLLEGKAFPLENLMGNLFVLLSVFAWVAYVLFSKQEFKKHPSLAITGISFLIGMIVLFPLAIYEQGAKLFDPASLLQNPAALAGLLYMTFFSSIIAYFTFNLGIKFIEVSEASLFTYLQPVFAAPLAIFWLKEKVTFPFLIGAALIGLGILISQQKKYR